MKALILFCLGLTFIAMLVAAFVFHVPVPELLTWGMGALCVVWLVVLVTLPWNLYFHAKHVLFEMKVSRERGMEVSADREAEVNGVRKRMLMFSVGAHLFSALFAAVLAWLFAEVMGFYFAGFFLLSTFFRPGVEYYQYLHQRLRQILGEVTHPREDVMELRQDVNTLKESMEHVQDELRMIHRQLENLRDTNTTEHTEVERKINAVSRKFEETVDKLTDNQEIITGIKAFLRLIQSTGPSP